MCPNCQHALAAIDLVPILSWLSLGGRCRYCRRAISWQYPAVETLTGLLYGLSAYQLHPTGLIASISFGLWLVILAIFIALAVYDLRWLLLPDRLTLPAAAVAAIMVLVSMVGSGRLEGLYSPILAALAAYAGFWLIVWLTRGRGMGGGDVKFVLVMGLLLGLERTALALFLAFNSGAIIGVGLLVGRRLKSHMLPFGPFLITATIISYLYGRELIGLYLRLSGLSVG